MNSPEVKYPEYEDFLILLFAILKEQLDFDPVDPLPDYRKEDPEQLHKILTFVRHDDFYPTILEKASYLFASIVQGHIYSNGNKRLALVTMLYFLNINDHELSGIKEGELKELAIHVADSQGNQGMSFDDRKNHVLSFLQSHTAPIKDNRGRNLWDLVKGRRKSP